MVMKNVTCNSIVGSAGLGHDADSREAFYSIIHCTHCAIR